jgi:hypothetical protein
MNNTVYDSKLGMCMAISGFWHQQSKTVTYDPLYKLQHNGRLYLLHRS